MKALQEKIRDMTGESKGIVSNNNIPPDPSLLPSIPPPAPNTPLYLSPVPLGPPTQVVPPVVMDG
ncbi:hypothetical protein E2C01_010840 [Portunus trituberculatus]|uniref:Uncharacterized protein n=1 Tax=Portunus trituberculatus TaxID=210409 RepID=A0A5B7D9H5_PORTR|nr:hypothetical protein [Portunus trituberculatus]